MASDKEKDGGASSPWELWRKIKRLTDLQEKVVQTVIDEFIDAKQGTWKTIKTLTESQRRVILTMIDELLRRK
ncbi:hypothetical protein LCGC14_0922680 [marine sediment metagenome]|uniref:Uncharacterized protein n=1 Tax=marine sediment metagenome TaxID=412755 RepID=A0A0F9RWY1_9ZZZZ